VLDALPHEILRVTLDSESTVTHPVRSDREQNGPPLFQTTRAIVEARLGGKVVDGGLAIAEKVS
jgi:hypothetical protein